jgi:hypothetical protein
MTKTRTSDPLAAATRVGAAFRALDHKLDALSGNGNVAAVAKALQVAGGRRVSVQATPQQWTVRGQPVIHTMDDYIAAAINPKDGSTYLGGFNRTGRPVLFEMPHPNDATVIAPNADGKAIAAALLRGLHG